jgi:hypothetical protein
MLPSTSRVTSLPSNLGKEEKRKELNAEVEKGKTAGAEIERSAEAEIEEIVENAETTIVRTERTDLPEEITVRREVLKEEEVEIETND